jgi:hypothetical protein
VDSVFPPSAAGVVAGAGEAGASDSVGDGAGVGGTLFGLGLPTGGIRPHLGSTATTPLQATSILTRISNLGIPFLVRSVRGKWVLFRS